MKNCIISAIALVLAFVGMIALASAYETLGFGKTILIACVIGLVEYLILAHHQDR